MRLTRASVAAASVIVAATGVVGVVVANDDGGVDAVEEVGDDDDALVTALAAERWVAAPSAESLRNLFAAVGGVDGMTLGTTVGVHSTITFDPSDTDVALATLSDLSATGQTDVWSISADGISVTAYAPGVELDDARFNRDGTIIAFGPNEPVAADRPLARATIRDLDGAVLAAMPEIRYEGRRSGAGRSASDGESVFIIPANIIYADKSENEPYGPLTALRPDGPVQLTERVDLYEWIDVVSPGVLVAFPGPVDGTAQFLGDVTAVWDTRTLEPLADHPLADRELVRAVVTADGSVAFGVDFDGVIQVIEMATGDVVSTFGSVDVGTARYPLAVDGSGTVLMTTSKTTESSAVITMWFVPGGEAAIEFRTATARGLNTPLPFTWDQTAGVAFDTSRVALRTQPRPEGITWTVIDTNVDDWVQAACSAIGRALTTEELANGGIETRVGACG
jgi:hypothetical protein